MQKKKHSQIEYFVRNTLFRHLYLFLYIPLSSSLCLSLVFCKIKTKQGNISIYISQHFYIGNERKMLHRSTTKTINTHRNTMNINLCICISASVYHFLCYSFSLCVHTYCICLKYICDIYFLREYSRNKTLYTCLLSE